MNNRIVILCGVALFFAVMAAGCTTMNIPANTMSRNAGPDTINWSHPRGDMVAFVDSAVEYARLNGKETALQEFDKRNGSFMKGDLYIYAYDFNGTVIAHPVNPELIGVNRLREKDAHGDYFIRNLMDAALNGSGFVSYYYINPVHNNTVEQKLGYVKKVDETWWLGSGVYSINLQ
jgi:cytochrome c